MPDNVCTPYFDTSDITFYASAAVTGKRFVNASADRTGGPGLSTDGKNVPKMAHATAGGAAFGVACYDVAQDALGAVIGTPGRIVPVTADGAISAGAQVMVGSSGKAKAYAGAELSLTGNSQTVSVADNIVVGICLSGATDGNDATIKLI